MKNKLKTRVIQIRVTEENFNKIKEMSAIYSRNMTDFIENCIFQKARFADVRGILKTLGNNTNQLQRIGKNFNQLIKMAHNSPEALNNDLWRDAILEHLKGTHILSERYNNDVGKILNILRKL